ncbi:TrmB family transcriptional regulator [Priestia taiwanensis]|uniref:Transcriptional regulator n=1 Tax=Priestia taiwanensis TaxID=1347902 RepID=A0A917EQX0_9BACI|nr:TrmB family transcriptional regulator [Priestia taiwanensis]MBM7363168.1 sugar-specific transcriptional regulator TrmB [Priestia taiwanensis]GGE68245.1 transcriptional regulator [Priestia taiwanensis]
MIQKFGFSQYESNVYEALVCSEEPLDTTQIVKYSGVPKAKVYEILSRMADKGMIMESLSEKKKCYSALPLPLVIEKLTAEFQANVDELKSSVSKKRYADDRVWSLKVDSSIQAQCHELIEKATTSIKISSWHDDFIQYVPALERKQLDGVKVEALVVGKVESKLSNIHFLVPADEHHLLERYRLMVIDDSEIIFAGVEEEAWQAIKTASPPLVKFFSEFFYHDLALMQITEKFSWLLMDNEEIKETLMRLRY